MILPFFSKTTVRLVAFVSPDIGIDSHLATFVKLNHAIAGIYMCVLLRWRKSAHSYLSCNNLSWETVFTAGFELDVLRGKRPYRWTIWVSSVQLA
jgi:hypothetical protein